MPAIMPKKAERPMANKEAALWYARRGWHIFPLRPRTKEPFSGIGVYQATCDLAQIDAWWSQWPKANIGCHCGASGLIAIDLDKYKDNFGGDALLTRDDQETVTNLTGNGGTHLIYAMPDGARFGNATANLPDGIDIRGFGGYIILPPSIHPNGRAYAWEIGYGPQDLQPRPLPAFLEDLLRAAKSASGENAEFTDRTLPRPDLTRFNLSKRTVQMIYEGHLSKDRSETDQSVISSLVSRGASNDEILAVFNHFPIGTNGKFSEKGERYLAHSVGRARTFLNGHVPTNGTMPAVPEPAPEELRLEHVSADL